MQRLTPPRLTPLLTAAINDNTMPAPLFRSYARLYAAAWPHGYRRTDPLDFDAQLVPLLGVGRAQARQHLRLLRFAKLLTWTSDGRNRYVISFPPLPESTEMDSGVGGGEIQPLNPENLQQHPTESEKPDSAPDLPPSPGAQVPQAAQDAASDEIYRTALRFLRRAGVWNDTARRIAAQVAENERRPPAPGEDDLPGLADVLGWMAYCFADQEKNNLAQPAAVLAVNLGANRRCPAEYRPQPVCESCGLLEEYCDCQDGPARRFPQAFLERAFQRRDFEVGYRVDRWGVCLSCRAWPCQCEER